MEDPTKLTDEQVFGLYRNADEGSRNRATYGGEILRRQFEVARRSAENSAKSARSAQLASYAALATALINLLALLGRTFGWWN